MNVESSIFKAYDIRGVYPDHLNEETGYAVGRAFSTLLIQENQGRQLTVGVSSDMRSSSPSLKKEIIRGIIDTGVNVVDMGMLSSGAYYFGVSFFNLDGGIEVTASHNAKEYNGFKIVRARSVAMGGKTGIEKIHQIILKDEFLPLVETKGTIEEKAEVTQLTIEEYLKFSPIQNIKPMKVVLDPANAMGIVDFDALEPKLSTIEVVKMNYELDGSFPNHEADPSKPENRVDVCNKVKEVGADLGITTDGDDDRIFFIDETGEVVPSSILYTIMAHIEHEEYPGETLAYEIRLGNLIAEEFPDVKLVQTPVGHSLIKGEMLKHNALFGGEISGHYFFRFPWGTYEAPMLMITKFLNWLSKQDKPLSEIIAPLKRYVSSGEVNTKIATRTEVDAIIAAVKEKYKDGDLITIDGVKVSYPDYWFSVRASNTEPLIRLIVEAKDKTVMESKRDELMAIIKPS